MLILMLSNYTFDALLQGQSIQSVEIERQVLYSINVIFQGTNKVKRVCAIKSNAKARLGTI